MNSHFFSEMVILQNRAYVKPVIMTLQTSQCVPMAAISESKFLSLQTLANWGYLGKQKEGVRAELSHERVTYGSSISALTPFHRR